MIAKTASIYKKTSEESNYIFFIKDYFSLVKPKVMTLVVFTAFVGVFVAPVNIHPWLAFVSIFCIALGSGAAGAFNMWYESDLDLKMLRTRKRVLPSHKIKKSEAFSIAVFLTLVSVYVMAVTINYYAAAFLAFSIFFYVVIYTIWLKPKTKYNIVIGGAAGAFPPLIGWLSVTNSLDILPLLMFIFTISVSFIFHTDFSNHMQIIAFLKNISIAGGFLIIASYEAKLCTIDYYLKYKKSSN